MAIENHKITTKPDEHLEFTVVLPDGERALIKATGFGWSLDRKPDECDEGFRKRLDAVAALMQKVAG